jgi:hypothetical protein
MGDDEFFGSTAARNPLTLDELVSFGRQLLNIAFILYWRDDQTSLQVTSVSSQIRCTWEDVRDKVTKCLLDIHARECVFLFIFLIASTKINTKYTLSVPGNHLYLKASGSLRLN